MSDTPKYNELPELGDTGVKHSWGLLPTDIGTLSFAGSSEAVAATRLVHSGTTIPLNLPINAFDPPLFARQSLRHSVVETSRNDAEDVLSDFNPQASTQLDGLAHVRAGKFGYYGGIESLTEAREDIGMQHMAARGITARGVLLDIATLDRGRNTNPGDGAMYDVSTLEEAADAQYVDIRPGDIVLIRTGWVDEYFHSNPAQRSHIQAWNGLRADSEMAAWLWDHRVAAVGADNPAVECAPGSREIGSLHRRLLPALGMPLFELLDLERLRNECASTGIWEFLFVSVPLNLTGGVSSPANAMAVL